MYNWIQFFIFMYNDDMTSKINYFIIPVKKGDELILKLIQFLLLWKYIILSFCYIQFIMNEKESNRFSFAKSCFIDMPFGKEKDVGSGI